ncbi:hypothetical protein [Candidatus Regiella endosymbiont of Tuberolachnus salignus]|uniref:hypothetical protein n=1 Tax=Candidatus Regiella endosymbiont of Tuberolachnus salignus TaxID=3077956 RepID=UPI0030CB2382
MLSSIHHAYAIPLQDTKPLDPLVKEVSELLSNPATGVQTKNGVKQEIIEKILDCLSSQKSVLDLSNQGITQFPIEALKKYAHAGLKINLQHNSIPPAYCKLLATSKSSFSSPDNTFSEHYFELDNSNSKNAHQLFEHGHQLTVLLSNDIGEFQFFSEIREEIIMAEAHPKDRPLEFIRKTEFHIANVKATDLSFLKLSGFGISYLPCGKLTGYLPNVKSFDLSENNISLENSQKMIDALPEGTEIDLSNNPIELHQCEELIEYAKKQGITVHFSKNHMPPELLPNFIPYDETDSKLKQRSSFPQHWHRG